MKISQKLMIFVASTSCFFQTLSGYQVDLQNGHVFAIPSLRWDSSATHSSYVANQPLTLTWGIVPDGTTMDYTVNTPTAPNAPSNLISYFDGHYGVTNGGSDLTQRPWFHRVERDFKRFSELSGLNLIYVPYDDGVTVGEMGASGPMNNGVLGVRADIRIGGRDLSLVNNADASANFPFQGGDIFLSTGSIGPFANPNNQGRRGMNIIGHELGHALAGNHYDISFNSTVDRRALLDPGLGGFIAFDGPQHSDILGVHTAYGDVYETYDAANISNSTVVTATDLGNIDSFSGIGFDAMKDTVELTDTDFVSISGNSDIDVYQITLSESGYLDVELNPMGYDFFASGVQVNTKELSDLHLSLIDKDGVTVLASHDLNGLGFGETVENMGLEAGDYYIRIGGNDPKNTAQFYSLTTNFEAGVIPEPSSAILVSLGVIGLLLRRGRRC